MPRMGSALLKLHEQAEEMPPELRPFCTSVVQMLGIIVGHVSAGELADRIEAHPGILFEDDEEQEKEKHR